MKIVAWGINYAPEQTGIAPYNTGLCRHLAAAGHDVRMLTTFPYYPEWRKRKEDRGRIYRMDTMDGVRVHRCWHYVPPKPNALRRMIHEASFVLTSFLRCLTLPTPDLIIIVSPPLLLGTAAWLACRLKRTRYVFHVQDMQPDAAVMLGLLKPGKLTRLLYAFERAAHRHASLVSGITPGMLRLFTAKGVSPHRQILFPNWTHDVSGPAPAPGAFRAAHRIADETFLAVYSGNLGKKQGLGAVLQAAALLERMGRDGVAAASHIKLVIAGDGVEKPALEAQIERERLHNVLLLPLQPNDRYRELLVDANVCLVTQQPGSGALFFPSKLLTILDHGRPIITVADPGGELENSVQEGGFGWSVPPGDAAAFARALLAAAGDPGACSLCGRRGKEWVSQFSRPVVLGRFETEIVQRFSPGDDRRASVNAGISDSSM